MRTLILGASPKPERVAYQAATMLQQKGFEAIGVGLKEGLSGGGMPILEGEPALEDIHTVTLYLGPANQKPYYNYVLSLKPKRVIFNPGTENPEFYAVLRAADIEVEVACTLVLLSLGAFF